MFMSSHIFEEIEAVCDRVAMIKDGHIIDTISLYDLRHPSVKNFIVDFEQIAAKQAFMDQAAFTVESETPNRCTVQCSTTQLDAFFNLLKNYPVVNLQEIHLSLQQQFMSAYMRTS